MSGPSRQPAQTSSSPQDTLYEARKKLYVRAVSGVFANWRWVMVWLTQLVFYGLPWLSWNDRQAVLFHLAERKFYLFGWVFWPQDVFFLAVLLIISAYALFFFTAIAGRLWCGYACPQTVYTEIFMWIEQKIEGDHIRRQKLDQAEMSAPKALRRGGKFLVWGLFSLWTGFTFVAYFSPLEELLRSIPVFGFGPWELFWILFYAAFTYLFAGVMREQVCTYMCPYARFQAVMFDPDTLVITYDEERGEPRGARRKGIDPKAVGKGDCIDCGICVQVCPTGIDIRNGLQYMCIGCAACIDACDQVMEKMDYPKGLIRYSTQNAIDGVYTDKEIPKHVFRPRTLFYIAVVSVITLAFFYTLAMRIPMRADVIRDRLTLSREVENGQIENLYQLRIINMENRPHHYRISATGIEGLRVETGNEVTIAPLSTVNHNVVLRADPAVLKRPSQPVVFTIQADEDAGIVREAKSSFLK